MPSLLPFLDEDDEDALPLELTEEEVDRPNRPSGGRLRSGALKLTLFFSFDIMSLASRDCVFNIGWYEELELPTLSQSGMANSGSSILFEGNNDSRGSRREEDLFRRRRCPSLPRTGARNTVRAAWTNEKMSE